MKKAARELIDVMADMIAEAVELGAASHPIRWRSCLRVALTFCLIIV
jgi:hypothetical protein